MVNPAFAAGCMKAPEPHQGSWQTGAPTENGLMQAGCEWTEATEGETFQVFQLSGAEAALHRGRAKGFATKEVNKRLAGFSFP